jgi:hypothetical protein
MTLEPQIVIHRDCYLPLRAQVALRGLDRRVPQQELDLFEVAARPPAELRAGTAEIVGPEALDANLLRRLLDDRPYRPVAQGIADLSALRDRTQQPAVLDSGGAHPGVDSLLDPDRDRDGSDPPSLPFEIHEHPAAFPELDGLDNERGQLLAAKGAADQERQDDVIALTLMCGPIGNGQQLLRLLPRQPVPQASSLLPNIRDLREPRRILDPDESVAPGLGDQFSDSREPDMGSPHQTSKIGR